MVYIVGLERIAEDLMGKRKWKLYQDSMQQRNYLQPLNNNVKKQQSQSEEDEEAKRQQPQEQDTRASPALSPLPAAAPEAGGADDAPPPAENGDANHHRDDEADAEDEYKVKDWSPTSKCMFCVDGKLDEHNNHGALSPRPSDSESSDAASDAETAPTLTPTTHSTLLSNHQRRASGGGGMTALETQMVAMAAAAALSGGVAGTGAQGQVPSAYYGPLGPTWLLSMSRSLHQAATAAAAGGQEDKPAGGEQPLDLSSKAGSGDSTPTDTPRHNPNAAPLRLSTLDNKHLFNSDFRAKPRMPAVGGRRTYTEEELQAALRDIQSGKLGTRRAAVIYGIPRSTLRNKVYKLALERERDAHLTSAASLKLTDEEEATDMDDKELSGAEEEKEVEKALEGPLLSYDDLLTSDPLKALLTKQMGGGGGAGSDDEQNVAAAAFGPHIQALLLRSLIGSKMHDGGGGGGDPLPDVMKRLFAQDFLNDQLKLQLAAQAAHVHAQSNGDLVEKIARERDRPSPSNSVNRKRDRDRDSDSETEDSGSNVILKIPSFRPTSTGSKNGGGGGGGSGDYSAGSMASPSVTSDSTSPPIALPLPGRGLYQKDVKDLIAKSISQKFQQSPEPPQGSAQQQQLPGMRNPILDYDLIRKGGRFTPPLGGGISVIKSAQEPRVPYQGVHHGHHQQSSHAHGPHSHGQNAQKSQNSNSGGGGGGSSGGGGKGTRPKRGKYRNYDRDSLVEAVRAVQRGEMSVHRAGSYYGVPHSTLEYKVKERHLMRPRKRDPKPNPVDEKIASLKQNDLRNAAAAAAAANEKMKAAAAAGIKPGPGAGKLSPVSPNGIKLPMYDPALGPLGYNTHPFPFWPHAASYPHLPLDYGRPTGAAAAAVAAAAAFPATNHDQLYASQMIQKLHEESRSFINPPAGGPIQPPGGANMSKSTRQMAESLLDPAESNGLLDGIIRSSLESGVPGDDKKEDSNVKPQNMSNKTLLDQLCRNSRLAPLSKFANEHHHESRKKENGDGDMACSPEDDNDPVEYKPDITTIELSNDSNDSKTNNNGATEENGRQDGGHSPLATTAPAVIPRPGMIYLKQELTKPENLKPEMLVRFHDAPRNGVGIGDDASASETETHD